MKKKFAILSIFVLAFVFSLFFAGCGSSQSNPYANTPDNNYRITDLSVTIDASAGARSMHITEDYTFEFDKITFDPSHGFYRDIAINSGEKIRNLKVYNASDFSDEFELSYPNQNVLRVRVGSPDRIIWGSGLRCTIEYTMITPPFADNPDALAVNAIGQGWSCKIRQADIKVILPENTNAVPEYFYGGWGENRNAVGAIVESAPKAGAKEYSFAVRPEYEGSFALDSYEGLTLYYYMPKGAFSSRMESYVWIVLAFGLVIIGVALALKFTIGKNAPLAPITNYYPPKHAGAGEHDLPMDPVDMGYLIDGTCQGSDVTSLIFYFASKGYLEVIEPKSKENKSDSFKLIKKCELPDGLPNYQYVFFSKIFGKKKEVTVSDLTNRTYTAVRTVQSNIAGKYKGKNTLYDNKTKMISVAASLLAVLYSFLVVGFSGMLVHKSFFGFMGLLALFPAVISLLFGGYLVNNRQKFGKAKWITFAVLYALVTAIPSMLLLLTHRDAFGLAEIIILIVSIDLCFIIAPFIARRTKYYTEELNEIVGFKEFLQYAEKERLETLLEENPQYYYDILPYANVLGVSDIWEDKFKGLTLEPPVYYRGHSVFTLAVFSGYYRHSYRAYSAATVSTPSSSSRSGGGRSFGGGGGFSGGGFGGGGGGRW